MREGVCSNQEFSLTKEKEDTYTLQALIWVFNFQTLTKLSSSLTLRSWELPSHEKQDLN